MTNFFQIKTKKTRLKIYSFIFQTIKLLNSFILQIPDLTYFSDLLPLYKEA